MEKQKYILNIDDKTYEYDGFNITYETVGKITFEQAKDILFTLKNKFEEKGLSFFLIFGTLLGAVRERSFISHDYDVDVATIDFDRMLKFVPEWAEEGFKICRHTPTMVSFMMDGVYIDVYRYQKSTSLKFYGLWCCQISWGSIIPKRFFREFEYIDFIGGRFLVPKNPERLMRWMYGKNWRVPIKDKRGKYDVLPLHYYRLLRKYLSKYINRKKIKKLLGK